MSRPFGGMPDRWDPPAGASDRVAVVLPGAGYSPAHPALEFARQALLQHGWTVQQVWWERPVREGTDPTEWVCDQARAAAERESSAGRLLLVAKSLGTFAAPYAAERGLAAVWLTPILREPAVVDAIRANSGRQLLVGGLADDGWDGEVAAGLDADVLEVSRATHFLHVEGDAVRSVEVQLEVSRAVEQFLTSLDVG